VAISFNSDSIQTGKAKMHEITICVSKHKSTKTTFRYRYRVKGYCDHLSLEEFKEINSTRKVNFVFAPLCTEEDKIKIKNKWGNE